MYCAKCGKDFDKKAVKFCPYCGNRTYLQHGGEVATVKKASSRNRIEEKSVVNKSAIIITIIVALIVVVMAFLVLNKDRFGWQSNEIDSTGSTVSNIEMQENASDHGEVPSSFDIHVENVGDTIRFGTWDGNSIEWRVLDIENDQALIISQDILAVRQFDGLEDEYGKRLADVDIDWKNVKVTWENSEIRKWLNKDFYELAFTEIEQESIILSRISNPNSSEYIENGCVDTEDKLFLLSSIEAEKYFNDNDINVSKRAHYSLTRDDIDYFLQIAEEDWGLNKEELDDEEKKWAQRINKNESWFWWFRTPIDNGFHSGDVRIYSFWEGSFAINVGGVRPALYIKL